MISIGSFQFPQDRTFYEVKLIEAKSKVRKEIHITTLLDESEVSPLQDQLELLQGCVEAYDRGQAQLSLNSGRYYKGRRRELNVLPDMPHQLAFVKFISLTDDRFERSSAVHVVENNIVNGILTQSVYNNGNWQSSPTIIIVPDEDITDLSIKNEDNEFQLNYAIPANTQVIINSHDRSVFLDTQGLLTGSDVEYPQLNTGSNSFEFSLTPNTANASVQIKYQDIWV